MAFVEIRRVQKVNHSLAVQIYNAQKRGKIKRYITKQGYACYNVEEWEEYKRTLRVGRPLKDMPIKREMQTELMSEEQEKEIKENK